MNPVVIIAEAGGKHNGVLTPDCIARIAMQLQIAMTATEISPK